MRVLVILSLAATAPALSRTIVETFGAPRDVIEDGPLGGNGGSQWSDGGEVHLNGEISSMELNTGSGVDGIRVKYGDVWGDNHGYSGDGAYQQTFTIGKGARITIVQGRGGDSIDMLEFITDDGAVFGPYGGNGGEPFVAVHPGCFLSYLSGMAGDRLDSLTLHWDCP